MKEKLDILFFAPPMFADGSLERNKILNDNNQSKEIPRGILCIASYLNASGRKARVIVTDAFFSEPIASRESLVGAVNDLILKKIREYNPDFVGFSMMFGLTEPSVMAMARFVKGVFPQKTIMVGGNHATFNADRLLDRGKRSGIDIVVRGEGEHTVEEIISGADRQDIVGISFRDEGGAIVHNSRRPLMPILNLPPNDYKLIDVGDGGDIACFNHMVQFARGCGFSCSFCANRMMWEKDVRANNPESFYTELISILEMQKRASGNVITIILDDDPLAISHHRRAIFNAIEKSKKYYPDSKFVIQTRVSSVMGKKSSTMEMLKVAKELGFSSFFLGIESGSQVILDAMHKSCKVEWIEDACENVKNYGIAVGAFWMFGHPGATVREENISLDFLDRLFSRGLIDEVEPHVTVPFPGTPLRCDPRVEILISPEEELERYCLLRPEPIHQLINPEDGSVVMSSQQISDAFNAAMRIKEKHLGKREIIANAAL